MDVGRPCTSSDATVIAPSSTQSSGSGWCRTARAARRPPRDRTRASGGSWSGRRPGVPGLFCGVALGARRRLQRRRSVRAVAVGARHGAMHADRVLVVLRLIVAAHAVRARDRLVAPEAVTVLADRCACSAVQWRRDNGMAASADLRRRLREASIAVTFGAGDLARRARRGQQLQRLRGSPPGLAVGGGLRCASARRSRSRRSPRRSPRASQPRDPMGGARPGTASRLAGNLLFEQPQQNEVRPRRRDLVTTDHERLAQRRRSSWQTIRNSGRPSSRVRCRPHRQPNPLPTRCGRADHHQQSPSFA